MSLCEKGLQLTEHMDGPMDFDVVIERASGYDLSTGKVKIYLRNTAIEITFAQLHYLWDVAREGCSRAFELPPCARQTSLPQLLVISSLPLAARSTPQQIAHNTALFMFPF